MNPPMVNVGVQRDEAGSPQDTTVGLASRRLRTPTQGKAGAGFYRGVPRTVPGCAARSRVLENALGSSFHTLICCRRSWAVFRLLACAVVRFRWAGPVASARQTAASGQLPKVPNGRTVPEKASRGSGIN